MLKIKPYFIFVNDKLQRIYSTKYSYKLKNKVTGETWLYAGVTSIKPKENLIDSVANNYIFISKEKEQAYNPIEELVTSNVLKN